MSLLDRGIRVKPGDVLAYRLSVGSQDQNTYRAFYTLGNPYVGGSAFRNNSFTPVADLAFQVFINPLFSCILRCRNRAVVRGVDFGIQFLSGGEAEGTTADGQIRGQLFVDGDNDGVRDENKPGLMAAASLRMSTATGNGTSELRELPKNPMISATPSATIASRV